MNYYMIYARPAIEEGAFLVFAHTAKEAKKTGYSYVMSLMDAKYEDVAVLRLRYAHWLISEADQDKLRRDEAHVIDDPKSCKYCMMWGQSPIGKDGLCEDCRRNREEDRTGKATVDGRPAKSIRGSIEHAGKQRKENLK